ncbi:probable inactive beta-glucosidase 14 isoform X3 [Sorghum bicolor]|uniref:probable inactive beta-glucosidase 14 isoform X3 n=1 Tax=Sorghum bicolor TaxID=4558 RepID=UPI00081AD390|nr:probable inactive beta-glucosidase 14 isoform X3 [Sorghum bicolor]|eukprot:XP_021318919.1 probable inactive beta-glucosidase 14 isoform X3 [Sorghum bicolor]
MAGVIIVLVFFLAHQLLPCASSAIDRNQFPPDFLFGTSTSAYQIEGGYLEGNKGLSNWDIFTHKQGTVEDGTNGDTADDHYHRYMEDIELIHSLGVNSYRFSIAWARILPKGRFGHVNPDGVAFYNALIDALLQRGIEPFVTISHYDIPYELEKRYGGWLSPKIRRDFGYLADVCFRMFGDRVKFWITFNEPNIFAKLSYIYGRYPPGHCSRPFGNCTSGNSSTEPYIVGHNMVLSHANVVSIYKEKYQGKQGGYIGITVLSRWYEPFRNIPTDILAVDRGLSFGAPWFLDPIILGDYPSPMRKMLGPNLPEFTSKQKKILQPSKLDFIGLNHYSTSYLKDCIYSSPCELDPFDGDAQISTSIDRDGILIGERTGSPYLNVVPYGMEKVVMYFKRRYNNTPMYITENGKGLMCVATSCGLFSTTSSGTLGTHKDLGSTMSTSRHKNEPQNYPRNGIVSSSRGHP